MSLIIVLLSVTAYLMAWLGCARLLYGHWRVRSIDSNVRRYPSLYRETDERGVPKYWIESDRAEVQVAAISAGLVWPVALPLVVILPLLGRFVEGSRRLSQSEMRRRAAAQDRRIAELEREAGIGQE